MAVLAFYGGAVLGFMAGFALAAMLVMGSRADRALDQALNQALREEEQDHDDK
jgi:hypothetical protein